MANNVQSLFGDEVTPPGGPVPQVVAFVERLLAHAKSGEMRAIAVAYVRGNGACAGGWERERSDGRVTFVLHSAIACLMGEFTDMLNETSVPAAECPVERPDGEGGS